MKLSTEARKRLKSSVFAGPHRSYPVNDLHHAEAALRLVGRGLKAGHITEEEAEHIRVVAHHYIATHGGGKGG